MTASDELLLRCARPGAALFDGWSDGAPRRLVMPSPEEVVTLSSLREIDDLPARDGTWVGFISYEALAAEEDVRPRDASTPEPQLFFALHRENRWSGGACPADVFRRGKPRRSNLIDSLGDGLHAARVAQIRNAIRDGDVYQVNLTRSFTAHARCDEAALYRALTGAQPPRSSAFIRGDGWSIVSASPEVFLHFDRERGIADSRPIKGTMRRNGDDDAEIAALLASDKDAAEHLMIVDVVRNDFGKIAPPGHVTVPVYRAVRTLESLHHLESIVQADGLRGASVGEVLAALAPAASITGAPKRAAVQMIRELEPVPRGVYCGAIGIITEREATFSVAIRTAVVTENEVRYHAGGGVVWDSDAAAEDDECRAKAAAFLKFVGAEA